MFPKPARGGSGYEQALTESKQRDPVKRTNGVANLGVFGDEKAIPTVKGFLQDESESVRVAAHYAMLLLGQAESIPKLIEYLDHEKHEFRKRSSVALATASGAGISANHEDREASASAKKDYEAWWKKNSGTLSWDAKKKTFVVSATKGKK